MLDFNYKKILVIGDIMLDSYWHGQTDRISPEAPVPVVKVEQHDVRPGGAANVALNIKSLGADVCLFGLCGDDENGNRLNQTLEDHGIHSALTKQSGLQTINKLRVLSQNQQLLRMDFERSYWEVDKTSLLESIKENIATAKMVVLSDYAKGTLSHVQEIIQLCKQHQVPVLVDPKGEDFTKYTGATLLTPNLKEFVSVVGDCRDEAIFLEKGQAFIDKFQLEKLLVTRGAQGMTLFSKTHSPIHLEAQAKAVYDVTGAGDTVIGVLSACLAVGLSDKQALSLANHAAGLVVAKVGTATVTIDELRPFLTPLFSEEPLVSLEVN